MVTAASEAEYRDCEPIRAVWCVIRKPFEVSELGNLVRLCVHGFDDATQRTPLTAEDRAFRDFAAGSSTAGYDA